MKNAYYQLCEGRTGAVIVEQLEVARSLWLQTNGLLGRKQLPSDGGIWLEPCNGIHTMGMRFAIDVLFLDRSGTVLKAISNVSPWHICWPVRGAHIVVEISAGAIAHHKVQPGNRLRLVRS